MDAIVEPKALLEGADVRGVSLRTVTRGAGGVGRVRLSLPKATPPGMYAGSVELGGRSVPVMVEVEPLPKVEASPSRLRFDVEPGSEVSADITLVNIGNVPFEVPAASKFCVFDGSGVDHAFWVALGADPTDARSRIDLLLDDLAESHGGLVEVRARPTKTAIAPGDVRDVEVSFRFSERLRAGCAYSGSWDAEGLHVGLRVEVPTRESVVGAAARGTR